MLLLQLAVAWSATCGSVVPLTDSTARYTAPTVAPAGGRCLVVSTRADGAVDTSTVTLALPELGGGVPFGPYALDPLDTTSRTIFTLNHLPVAPSTLVGAITSARARHQCLVLAMTAGHAPYLTNGVFDRAKWDARMQTFNTATLRAAVAQGVTDGTLCGANVMDEPYVHAEPASGGNTWGPAGTMTKARVDSLCGAVKQLFPTLAAGVAHQHQLFEPAKSYRICDFILDQYGAQYGSVLAWRDAGLAMAHRDGHAILFSLNILDGGLQDRDGTYDCTGSGQGGKGTYAPNCRMTPSQVTTSGLAIGPAGCGLVMWRYAADYMALGANVTAFRTLATNLAGMPRTRCRRP